MPLPMSLLHFNVLFVSICCLLMVSGYSWRERRAGVVALAVGVFLLLVVILVNIYASLYHWS